MSIAKRRLTPAMVIDRALRGIAVPGSVRVRGNYHDHVVDYTHEATGLEQTVQVADELLQDGIALAAWAMDCDVLAKIQTQAKPESADAECR